MEDKIITVTDLYNTREIEQRNLYRAKIIQNDTNRQNLPKWVIGNLQINRTLIDSTKKIHTTYCIQPVNYTQTTAPSIQTDTLCNYSGMTDTNNIPIWEHDIVEFLGQIGTIVYTAGCFGIAFKNVIDWDNISEKIPEITGCQNRLYACCNDNFISLWEIYWNFNEIDDTLTTVKIIGNTFDNPELLA